MAEVSFDEWLPVAFFSYIKIEGEQRLHQLWMTPLGQTDWRAVPQTTFDNIAKKTAYADCTAFNADDADTEL